MDEKPGMADWRAVWSSEKKCRRMSSSQRQRQRLVRKKMGKPQMAAGRKKKEKAPNFVTNFMDLLNTCSWHSSQAAQTAGTLSFAR